MSFIYWFYNIIFKEVNFYDFDVAEHLFFVNMENLKTSLTLNMVVNIKNILKSLEEKINGTFLNATFLKGLGNNTFLKRQINTAS